MLENVVTAVADALEGAGISAGPAYPKTGVERDGGCFVRVGVAKAIDTNAGFARYLGMENDPETGAREVYGLRCALELSLDVYAPLSEENAALRCAALFDSAAAAIGAISGLQVRELSCGAPGPDRETGMFRLSGRIKCAALLTASGESGAEMAFTDYVLRGELRAT